MEPLRFSWGSVIGADHVKSKKNCQDALMIIQKKDLTVAFVSDGCGDAVDSPFSEVGSRLGVAMVVNRIVSQLENKARWRWDWCLNSAVFWKDVQEYTLEKIEDVARGLGGDYAKNVVNHFLFTLVGMVMTPELTTFVGLGDGYYFLNGDKYQMMSETKDNMPVYLAYNLVETNLKKMAPEDLILRPRKTALTSSVDSLMIATDGLNGVLADPKKLVPGTKTEVGGPEEFWSNPKYFDNPFSLGWRLNLLASEKRTMVWDEQRMEIHAPIVTDDLALVVANRF